MIRFSSGELRFQQLNNGWNVEKTFFRQGEQQDHVLEYQGQSYNKYDNEESVY